MYIYMMIYPGEALIASQLTPQQFGAYMAHGTKKRGSHEEITFIEVEKRCSDAFDWDYADAKCVAAADGTPKHSLYLGVYRVLERVPMSSYKSLYLTTRDGRVLELPKSAAPGATGVAGSAGVSDGLAGSAKKHGVSLYKEMCPVHPLVLSTFRPKEFGAYMTSKDTHHSVPVLVYTDVKMINLDDMENTGHMGRVFNHNIAYVKESIQVLQTTDKKTKTIDRSTGVQFSYQMIHSGIFIAKGNELIMFKMPSLAELKKDHYDWGRSALLF